MYPPIHKIITQCVYIYLMYTYTGWFIPYTGAAAVVACDKEAWDRG